MGHELRQVEVNVHVPPVTDVEVQDERCDSDESGIQERHRQSVVETGTVGSNKLK